MRLGLISDIHSDHHSLERALALLDHKQVDQVYCLGDLVEEWLGNGNRVITRLREASVICVQGNHDLNTIQNYEWFDEQVQVTANWQDHYLTLENITYLRALRESLTFEWADQRVTLTHGTWYPLLPTSPLYLFKRFVLQAESNIVLLGHTHVAMEVHIGDLKIFNPGAVSRAKGGSHCAILDLPAGDFEVYDCQTQEKVEVPLIRLNSNE